MATTVKQKQVKRKHKGVYQYREGYYLNWAASGETYREYFSAKGKGGMAKAQRAAAALHDLLESKRAWIVKRMEQIRVRERE